MTDQTTSIRDAGSNRGRLIKDVNSSVTPKKGDMVVLLCDVTELASDDPYCSAPNKVLARRGDIGQWESSGIHSGANVLLEDGTIISMVHDSVQVLTPLELLALEGE